jgi:hypothetical protein
LSDNEDGEHGDL